MSCYIARLYIADLRGTSLHTLPLASAGALCSASNTPFMPGKSPRFASGKLRGPPQHPLLRG